MLPVGRAELRREGKGIAILAFGTMVQPALEAAETLDATVVNMRFVKPIDEQMILEMAASHDLLVTVDENVVAGGAGSAVNETLAAHGIAHPIINYGLPDRLIQHGSRDDMLNEANLTAEGITAFIKRFRDKAGEAKARVE